MWHRWPQGIEHGSAARCPRIEARAQRPAEHFQRRVLEIRKRKVVVPPVVEENVKADESLLCHMNDALETPH